MLKRLFRGLRAVRLYNRAYDAAVHRQWPQALKHLRCAFDELGTQAPSPIATVQMNILAAQVANNLNDGPLARRCAEVALKQMRSGRHYFGEADHAYVEAFCVAYINLCITRGGGLEPIPVDLSKIDLSRVSGGVRNRFPLNAGGLPA